MEPDDPKNWKPSREGFEAWLEREEPQRLVADLRSREQRLAKLRENANYFEPDYT